ncbi:MAG: type II toxin-antitoxin system Phd/YefM family antitoxin [Ignavibacteria bacterium]|nr:type II toxin-antitoxin system Phd/YefM family antitoxin [Ignavibacteria bacterium]
MLKLTNIKPISYFKANAAEMLQVLRETGEPYVITQNGEAAPLLDVKDYEQIQEKLALMQIIAIGDREHREGRYDTAESVFARVKKRGAARE